MATSGTNTFNQTRDQIITDSLVLLGVYGQEDTVSTNDLNFCSNILNKMVKAWEGQGIHLWTSEEATLFFTLGQQKYSLSSSSTDICGDYTIYTTLNTTVSGSSLTLQPVNPSSNFANIVGQITVGDNIGIKLDSGVLFWTTVATTSPTTSSVTLTNGLSGQASAGNNVFSFTNRTNLPLHIPAMRYRTASGYERPIEVMGRTQYMQIPNKDNPGPANQWYYAPKVSSAWLYLWPVADDVGSCVTFSYVRKIQDFDSSGDNPDLPQEWLESITYNLAVRVASAYGIATEKLNPDIAEIAKSSLQEMSIWDSEEGDLNIVPSYDYYY